MKNENCLFIILSFSACFMSCASGGTTSAVVNAPDISVVSPECDEQSPCLENAACVQGRCVLNEPVVCSRLTNESGAVCARQGEGSRIVLRGDVLAIDKVYEGGSVVIENGRIVYVGCEPDLGNAVVITCPDAVITPGFINAHEHLMYSNAKPADWGEERFDHRNEWRKGLNGHNKVNGPKTKHNETVEIRALMSGTTSIFGSGWIKGLARNIDEESIGGVQSIYQTFPLGDSSGEMRDSDCSYAYHSSVLNIDNGCPFGPHIGEGVGTAAHNELRCFGGEGPHALFRDNLVMIHGVAADAEDIAKMAQRGVKLIWSPRTNIALYGDTAKAPVFDRAGVTIGMGTDWIYSGSATMLRELQCADSVNQNYYNHYFSDYQLWRMPSWNNAVAFGLDEQLGDIRPGFLADISVFRKKDGKNDYRAVIEAENKDVLLVMLDGRLVYGDSAVMVSGEEIDVCGESRKLDLAATGSDVTFAEASQNAAYPMFFCGVPELEPTCTPARTREIDTVKSTLYRGIAEMSVDSDGDGIPDHEDNCPMMFNPVRPQDVSGKQSDADGDGIGDICDIHPLCSANDTSCPSIPRNDFDGDGIINSNDNCIYVANPDQADRDGDEKGDACDECPDFSNPGDMHCLISEQSTIKQVHEIIKTDCPDKNAACRSSKEVLVSGRVTALTKNGFFIQMPGESEVQWSAIYVSSLDKVQVNDDVSVQGYPSLSSGMPEIARASAKVVSSENEPVKPSEFSAVDIATGGPSAEAVTGVLVTLAPVVVQPLDGNAAFGMYPVLDTNGGSIYLDDFIWTITPALAEKMVLKRVTGILVYDFGNHKIAPRNAEDLK